MVTLSPRIQGSALASFAPPVRLYFIVPGLIALLGAGYLVVEDQQFRSSGRAAEGTVVELTQSTDRDGDSVLLPKVRYTNKAGKKKTFVVMEDHSLFGYAKGQKVAVLYSKDGSDERLDSLTTRWGIPGIIGFMGLLMTGVGLWMGSSSGVVEEQDG